MSMAIIGGITAAASVGMGIYGAVSAPGSQQLSPEQIASLTQQQISAQLAAFPELLKLNAAAQAGTATTKDGFTKRTVSVDNAVQSAQNKVDQLNAQLRSTPQTVPGGDPGTNLHGLPNPAQQVTNPAYTSLQQQLADANTALTATQKAAPSGGTVDQYFDPQGNPVTKEQATVDFSGLGAADVAASNADKTTQSVLDLEKKYGPDLVNQQLALQKLANPQGVAARDQEYQDIMARQNKPVDTTMGQTLQDQLQSELNAGTNLDPVSQRQVEQAARNAQAARGNTLGTANEFAEAASVGQAGEARRAMHQGQALSFLTSGATPQDVNFRNDQQNIGNLASFLSGQTPQAQFSQLAGNSAVQPTQTAQYNPAQLNPASVNSTAASSALGFSNFNLNAANNQANPWMAGLSTALKGVTGVGQAIQNYNSPTGSPAALPGQSVNSNPDINYNPDAAAIDPGWQGNP